MDAMKLSAVQQFARLKQQLSQERDSIVSRLAAINEVLGGGESIPVPAKRASTPSKSPQQTAYTPREGSLPAKILEAVGNAGTAMRVKEIAAAVKKSPMLVSQACLMLKRKGGLKKQGRGAYRVA